MRTQPQADLETRPWSTICAARESELRAWASAGDDRAYAELVRRNPAERTRDLPGLRGGGR